MSSVNESFFSFSFSPFIIFCLLVVSIISRVMSHTFVDMFPSHPPSLFLSPTHTHTYTDEQNSFSYSLSLTHTHPYKIIQKISYGARLFLNNLIFSIILLPNTLFVLCSVLPCLFCVLQKRKQHFYKLYL